jgi:glycosyltransferase involved in cell wall biosynthesis
MRETEKVSICMITYNHEQFIAQAIESVLAQQTDFNFKLYIGEDVSTDNTRDICMQYQTRYPDKIEVLPVTQNLGAIRNFKRTLEACQGDFIAILEGDDYWIHSQKLQMQYDFLSVNTDYTVCYTNNQWLHPDGRQEAVETGHPDREFLTAKDLLERNYVATQTCMFKNRLFSLPLWFDELYIGDWPLHILNALYGKVKHLPQITAVYRVHSAGIWSKLKNLKKEEHLVKMFESIRESLPAAYHGRVHEILKKKYYYLSTGYKKEHNSSLSRLYYSRYRTLSTNIFDKDLLKLTAKVYLFS